MYRLRIFFAFQLEDREWEEQKGTIIFATSLTLVLLGISICCIISILKNRKDLQTRKRLAPPKSLKSKKPDSPKPTKNFFIERMNHGTAHNSDDQTNDHSQTMTNQLPYSLSPPVAQSQPYSPSAPPEFGNVGPTTSPPPPYPTSTNFAYPPYPPTNTDNPSYATDLFSSPSSSATFNNPPYPTASNTETNFPSYPPKP